MVNQQIIDYIRNNIAKFPIETLKQALIKSGVSQQDAEDAARIVLSPQKAPPPPQQQEPAPAFDFALIIAQAKQVLLDPKTFFQGMPKGGGFIQPLVFMMTMALAGIVLASVLNLLLAFLRHQAARNHHSNRHSRNLYCSPDPCPNIWFYIRRNFSRYLAYDGFQGKL